MGPLHNREREKVSREQEKIDSAEKSRTSYHIDLAPLNKRRSDGAWLKDSAQEQDYEIVWR